MQDGQKMGKDLYECTLCVHFACRYACTLTILLESSNWQKQTDMQKSLMQKKNNTKKKRVEP